jgi:hypothetical protein
MGEQLETLGLLKLGEFEFVVDANLGIPVPGGRDIHIQNEKFRFQMYERDFVKFLAKIVAAQQALGKSKGCSE